MVKRAHEASLPVVDLDPALAEPLHRQLYFGVRRAILDGRLRPGLRLPSTRRLAGELQVSRNTVLAAFEQLAAEGYLESRTGAGSFVSRRLPDEPVRPDRPSQCGSAAERPPRPSARGAALARPRAAAPPGARGPGARPVPLRRLVAAPRPALAAADPGAPDRDRPGGIPAAPRRDRRLPVQRPRGRLPPGAGDHHLGHRPGPTTRAGVPAARPIGIDDPGT